jgi:hypothetical protein
MRNTALRVGIVAVLAVLAGSPPARAADVDGAQVYALTARSDITTVEYYDTTVPIVPPHTAVTVFSPATAQAELDSLGNSVALASAPEPGDFLRTLPGTAAGASGAPLPAYPLSVNSSYPTTPSAELKASPEGGASLVATSSDDESAGQSQTELTNSGADIGQAFASAHVARPAANEPMVAAAAADLRGMSFGELVHVSTLSSLASMASRPGQEPLPTTSTTIEGVTVAGVAVTVTPQGIALNGPTLLPVDVGQLTQQLHAAGIDLRYLPAEISKTSVRSAALIVTMTSKDDQGTRTSVLTLGRVNASLSDNAGGSSARAIFTPTVAPNNAALAATSDVPASGADVAVSDAPVPPAVRTSAAAAAVTRLVDSKDPATFLGLYLFCIAGGMLALIASRVLGAHAIRLRSAGR